MKTLKLEQINAYLPFDLKVKWGADEADLIGIIRNAVVLNGDYWTESQKTDITNIKPILFPLDHLTKYREDLGFVPWNKLEIESSIVDFVSANNQIIIRLTDCDFIYAIDVYNNIIQKLQEWKFDIHGLIEKNLAIAVTEEFNPYVRMDKIKK